MASQLRYLVFALLSLLLFVLVGYSRFEVPYATPFAKQGDSATSLQQVLQFIYNPSRFSITTPSFVHNGKTYTLPSIPRHTAPLGRDICILDVDTRSFDSEDQIFHGPDFDWPKLESYSGGIMNHYMYARAHGYDYKFYKANETDDRHPTWVKIAGLANTLKNYKYVVFLDADAIFNQMHVPIEWMLNYWSIDSTISLTMALDPPGQVNEDKRGRLYSNTGFIIAQNNPKTFEILKAWDECPTETRYKGCAEWNKVRFHEQSAYGSYIRYDYNNYLKELPCGEANGEWDLELCQGVFIQHMWWRTATVRSYFGDKTLQSLMGRMHAEVINEKDQIMETQD
ncbi:hypothetical protein BDV95DRAFT_381883 [Massariosphaeria phaeospora]|uniref:Nucleotide-diphospho-sugar transferase domain-containing protein n=1 Tax=Massariosphaeria phaeospora TaxID=100035 RepID=A0A7C8MFZ0_9PLEO|nr:hypothetical protein BDV95DRAFT_381883 [Massariosphaeria phaeospora]